jgi:hypothetical protein
LPSNIQSIIGINDQKSLEIFEDWFQRYVCIGEVAAYAALNELTKRNKSFSIRAKMRSKQFLKTKLQKLKKSKKLVRLAKIISE